MYLNQSNNSSFLQIENNLKKAINNMKFEIETKIKNEQKKIRTTQTKPYHPYKYKNRLCSTPNLNNLKIVEKRSGRLSLIPISIKNNLIKKTKRFDLDEENNKN